MHRKLRRRLNALSLSLALSAALPLTALVLEGTAGARQDGVAGTAPSGLEAAVGQEPSSLQPRRRRASSRDALSLPFFSFARTLRRGNGS